MKQIEELVATSADFNSENVQVILCKDDTYLCILANKKVRHYYLDFWVKARKVINEATLRFTIYYNFRCQSTL